jgi:predicted anti-sigma-YlaC factor YlaD
MVMEREMFKRWVHKIFTTQDEEMDCGELYEALSRFVDLELSGEDVACLLPDVCQHLEQCRECEELHQALLEVARLEAEGKLPEAEDLLEAVLGRD